MPPETNRADLNPLPLPSGTSSCHGKRNTLSWHKLKVFGQDVLRNPDAWQSASSLPSLGALGHKKKELSSHRALLSTMRDKICKFEKFLQVFCASLL